MAKHQQKRDDAPPNHSKKDTGKSSVEATIRVTDLPQKDTPSHHPAKTHQDNVDKAENSTQHQDTNKFNQRGNVLSTTSSLWKTTLERVGECNTMCASTEIESNPNIITLTHNRADSPTVVDCSDDNYEVILATSNTTTNRPMSIGDPGCNILPSLCVAPTSPKKKRIIKKLEKQVIECGCQCFDGEGTVQVKNSNSKSTQNNNTDSMQTDNMENKPSIKNNSDSPQGKEAIKQPDLRCQDPRIYCAPTPTTADEDHLHTEPCTMPTTFSSNLSSSFHAFSSPMTYTFSSPSTYSTFRSSRDGSSSNNSENNDDSIIIEHLSRQYHRRRRHHNKETSTSPPPHLNFNICGGAPPVTASATTTSTSTGDNVGIVTCSSSTSTKSYYSIDDQDWNEEDHTRFSFQLEAYQENPTTTDQHFDSRSFTPSPPTAAYEEQGNSLFQSCVM